MSIAYWIIVLILFIVWAVDSYKTRAVALEQTLLLILQIIIGVAVFGIPG